jgi:exopolysaccharide production protein ExoQ
MMTQIARASILALLVLSAAVIFAGARRFRLDTVGLGLWLALGCYALALLLSVFLGLRGGGILGVLMFPVVATAMYMALPSRLDDFLTHVRRILLAYAYGSVLAIALVPNLVLQRGYDQGLFARFDIRLHGLASHANELAALLLMYLALDWARGQRTDTLWRSIHFAVIAIALVLTQSKTMWIALVVLGAIQLAFGRGGRRFVYGYLCVLFGSLALLTVSLSRPWAFGAAWSQFIESERVHTFTGRDGVWQYTLDVWRLEPWFGYGPLLWDSTMAREAAYEVGWLAQHAHNQVIHTLGEAGIVGLSALIIYLIALLVYGARLATLTAGASLGILAILFVRGTMEVPLHASVTASFLSHMMVFGFLIVAARDRTLFVGDPSG